LKNTILWKRLPYLEEYKGEELISFASKIIKLSYLYIIIQIPTNTSCPLCGNNIEQVYATTLPDGAVRILRKY
jgi:hypothetical protein